MSLYECGILQYIVIMMGHFTLGNSSHLINLCVFTIVSFGLASHKSQGHKFDLLLRISFVQHFRKPQKNVNHTKNHKCFI